MGISFVPGILIVYTYIHKITIVEIGTANMSIAPGAVPVGA
jgi:hypothetical protein